MVKFKLNYGLPFCSLDLVYKGQKMNLDNVLIDTGSGGTILKMDEVENVGITIEEDDIIETISGVGGTEFVYKKYVECLSIGDLKVDDFKIEVGVMDYGFEINGIVGMDFLTSIGAVINLNTLVIETK